MQRYLEIRLLLRKQVFRARQKIAVTRILDIFRVIDDRR